jgi:hypothetical protein
LDEHPLLREYWIKGDNRNEGLYSTQRWDWKTQALKRGFLSSLLSEQDKILGKMFIAFYAIYLITFKSLQKQKHVNAVRT